MKSKKSVEKAVRDFKSGKFVIVLDHKKRENEADLILAGERCTPEKVNFMITHAKGLVCVPMEGKRLDELKLPLMTKNNTEFTKCAFTIPVDAKGKTTTGISAFDRAATIKTLIDSSSKPSDFLKPGHVFPLRADSRGLKARKGHTEACIEMCRLAGLYPAAVLCEIIGKDGRMARGKELKDFAKKFKIEMVSIEDLLNYQNI
jgi:3,4-dihydroxy-2-butanone 4-phosphate synthase